MAQRPVAVAVAVAQRPPPVVLARPEPPVGPRMDSNGLARRQQGEPNSAALSALSNAEHLEALRRIRERKRPAPVTLPPPSRRRAVPVGPGHLPPGLGFEPLAPEAPPPEPGFHTPGVPPSGLGYTAPLGGPPMDIGPQRHMARPQLGDGSMQAAQQMPASEPRWLGSGPQATPMPGQLMQGVPMQGQPMQQQDEFGRPGLPWQGAPPPGLGLAMPTGPAEGISRPVGDRGQYPEGPGPGQRLRQHSSQETWPSSGPDSQGFPGQGFAPQAAGGQGPPPKGFGGQQRFAHQAALAPAQPQPQLQQQPLPPQVMEAVALAVGDGLDRRMAQDIVQRFQRERPRAAGENDGGALLYAMRGALAHAHTAQGLSGGTPAGQAPWGSPGFEQQAGLGPEALHWARAPGRGEPPGAQQLWAGQHHSPQLVPSFAPNQAPNNAQQFSAWAPTSQPPGGQPQQPMRAPTHRDYGGAAQSGAGQQAAGAREWTHADAQRSAGPEPQRPDPAWLPPKKRALRGGGGGREGSTAGRSGRGAGRHGRQSAGDHHAQGRHSAGGAPNDSTWRPPIASGQDRLASSLHRGDAPQGAALEPRTLARVSTSIARPVEGKGVVVARLRGQADAAPPPLFAAAASEAEEEEEGEISI